MHTYAQLQGYTGGSPTDPPLLQKDEIKQFTFQIYIGSTNLSETSVYPEDIQWKLVIKKSLTVNLSI